MVASGPLSLDATPLLDADYGRHVRAFIEEVVEGSSAVSMPSSEGRWSSR